jgi:hypothetical protein
LRATLLAGLVCGLVAGPVAGLALLGTTHAEDAEPFLGFRLLDLENQAVKWRSPTFGSGAVITYAFATAPVTTEGARNCQTMLPPAAAHEPSQITGRQFRREVAAAFRMWEHAANVAFRETRDTAAAGILIGAQANPVGRAFTNVALKPSRTDRKVIARSLICLNPKQPWKVGFDGRLGTYDLRYTIAHEIGHAIGLDHPSAAGQLMSYRYDEKQDGLQPGDIRGAVLLYGPRAATRRFATGSVSGGTAPPDADRGQPFGIGDRRAGSSPKAIIPR